MKRLCALIVVGMVFVFFKTSAQFNPFAVWQARDAGPDETPDSIDWSDFNNYSENLSITGFDSPISVEISVSNLVGTPTVSFSKNSGVIVVVAEGAPETVSIVNEDRLQFFLDGTESWSASITVKNMTDGGVTLDTVTGELVTSRYLVMSNSTTNGDLGGLDGANAWCLDELKNRVWEGKDQVTLNKSTVKAFLCAGSQCQNVKPSTTYTYAAAGSSTIGGDTFTSTASGAGPNDRNSWRVANIFGTSTRTYWTGRGNGSSSLWGMSSDLQDCSGWTTGLSGESGETGLTNATNTDRWNEDDIACNASLRLLCMVDDQHSYDDVTPDAVAWSDFNIMSENQTFTGINETLAIDVVATSITGDPTFYFSLNNGPWLPFDDPDRTLLGISSGDQLKFRVGGDRASSATLSIINKSDGNTILDSAIATVMGAKFFVLSKGTSDGNLGGFIGADAWCLDDLLNNDWLGKASADINAATVKAFLCGSSGCQNLDPDSTYLFARSGSSASGGAMFSTNGSGTGPGDSKDWSDADAFNISTTYYMGRNSASSTSWSNAAVGDHCLDWSNGGSESGRYGTSNTTNADRWRHNDIQCTFSRRLICLVSDTHQMGDVTPDAIAWADFGHLSSTQTLSGVDSNILVEITASSFTGTPDLFYSKNSGAWVAFSGTTVQVGLNSSDTLAFKIDGTRGEQATLTLVNKSDGDTTLDTVTGTVSGKHFFVLSRSTSNGNFGGLLGANSWCVGDLQANNWKGKESVNVNGTTVRAFLCDSSGCNDVHASTLYYFARSNSTGAGGGSFVSNAMSRGPGNTMEWVESSAFSIDTFYWTGRASGATALWPTAANSNHCSDWTDDTSGEDGRRGESSNDDPRRWSQDRSGCNGSVRVICLVDD